MSDREDLARGISALGLELPSETTDRMLRHLELVEKWNRVYNLTAVRERARMVTHHLLDCLAILPHVSGHRIADVGSGAGFPGIPLALARPASTVALIESNHKKSAFLQQAAIELSLTNVTVIASRVESILPERGYDLVVSRAFSDLAEFVTLAGPLCSPGGMLAAMKGVYPDEELASLPGRFRLNRVVPVIVPGLPAERHLVLLEHA